MPITWFTDSPDAGDPRCICSWCDHLIEEKDATAVRIFDSTNNTEARFHRGCYGAALGMALSDDGDEEA